MGSRSGIDGVLDVAIVGPGASGAAASLYATPDGRNVAEVSNGVILFTDDFGGSALDAAVRWDVLDGGLGANPTLHGQTLAQGAIGSGVAMGNGVNGAANTALSVAGSALSIAMGTTSGAELWLISQRAFAGAEDLFLVMSKSQALSANSIFVGLVEVDPVTLIPLLNPNLAGYFTNMGGVELGATTSASAYACQAIGDSSGTVATGGAGAALAALTTTSEFQIEFHAEDIIGSNGAVDSAGGRSAVPSRVSSQSPDDARMYKLLIRLRNTAAPASSTTVTFQRMLLWVSQEMRVEVTSGRGDLNAQKGLAANITNATLAVTTTPASNSVPVGGVSALATSSAALSASRLTGAAASGNAKTSAGRLFGWTLLNTNAATRFLQIYAKASAPVPGTDTPALTIALAGAGRSDEVNEIGVYFASGVGWAVTTDAAGATAGAAADIVGSLIYV